MRRTGKTTFLWQVLADRVAAGLPREGILYVNFDDERLAEVSATDLASLLEEYYRLHPEWRGRRRATFLLDEIQLVPGWERFARRVLDTEKVELFISGSSARMLSGEVASSMRGRAMGDPAAAKRQDLEGFPPSGEVGFVSLAAPAPGSPAERSLLPLSPASAEPPSPVLPDRDEPLPRCRWYPIGV